MPSRSIPVELIAGGALVWLCLGLAYGQGSASGSRSDGAAVNAETRNGDGSSGMKALAHDAKVVLLHHSTGGNVWNAGVAAWFENHNKAKGTNYRVTEQAFPKSKPYGWKNYPFDYWNIWVAQAGDKPFMTEPTLEMLTKEYDVISFKHCFPVSRIKADDGKGDVKDETKTLANYKLQYEALKAKMRSFPDTRFVVWTAAALVQGATDEQEGKRTRTFVDWVKDTWDEPGDNIFVWDFHDIETDGGLFLKPEYAAGKEDSHPNEMICKKAAVSFCEKVVSVIEGKCK
jgi:hypothetical protein